MVATAVFVAGAASVLQLVTLAIAYDLRARQRTEATTAASQKIEDLLAAPWAAETSAADELNGYSRTWTVRPLASSPDSGVVLDVRVIRGGVEQARIITVKVRRTP
jgi:Tfp pilus assembly protein PilV